MDVLIWIAIGLALGVAVDWLQRSRSAGECLCVPLASVLGAVLGGWIGAGLTVGPVSSMNARWPSFLLAVLGAIVLLLVYRVTTRRNHLVLIETPAHKGLTSDERKAA